MCRWNGCNILFFKYKDENGKTRISAKTKGSHKLSNTNYGPFFDLTLEALKLKKATDLQTKVPKLLKPLVDGNDVQSISYELCGRKEKHLVKYDFDIALKPLFFTYYDGKMKPWIYNDPNHEM